LGMRWFAAGSWLRAAAVATANDDNASARTALEVVTARRESVAEQVLAYEAAARLALLDNRRLAALRAVRDGLACVDARRSAMEAAELRAGVSGWGDGLAQLGVVLANDAGRPRAMLTAVERWRASAMSSRPVRPPRDEEDAKLLGRLRSASSSFGAALRSGRGVPEAEARMRQAEADVSRRARQQVALSAVRTERVMSTSQIIEEVGDRTLIEFVDCSGTLFALVVRNGRVRRIEIGPVGPIRHACDAVMQVLRRLGAVVGTPAAGLVAASARAYLGRVRALLAAPLANACGGSEIIVVPAPDLHDIPWAQVLGVSTPVAVAPSAGEWVRAGRATRGDHVVVVAGPGLPGANEEAEQVADLHRPSQLLTHDLATVARVGELLDGASLAHLAAHATIRPSSPLFSSVLLADGPATAYDLEALQQAPRIMVLSACSAGSASKRSGGELLGLSTALMSAGTSCLIAPTIPIPDFGSIELVVAFHRQLRQGATTGEAVASVTKDIDSDDPAGLVSACTLTCYGRGDLRL